MKEELKENMFKNVFITFDGGVSLSGTITKVNISNNTLTLKNRFENYVDIDKIIFFREIKGCLYE